VLNVPHILFHRDGSVACYSVLREKSIEQIASSTMTLSELRKLQYHSPFVVLGQISSDHYYAVNLELPTPTWTSESVRRLGYELELSWGDINLKDGRPLVDLSNEKQNSKKDGRPLVGSSDAKQSSKEDGIPSVGSSDNIAKKHGVASPTLEKLSSTTDSIQRRNVGGREREFYLEPRSDSKHPKVFALRCTDIDDNSDVVRI